MNIYIIVNNLNMLYYDRIDFSEGTDVNETSASKECNICYYWNILKKGFTFQPNVCNRCHEFLMIPMNLSNIAILTLEVPIITLFLSELP